MKAIFLKEFRQWWKLGAVGLVILSAILCQRGMQSVAEFRPGPNATFGLFPSSPLLAEPAKQWVFAAGMALFAFALGFAQSRVDADRDRRAFLLHRPLSPRRIFLARSAAGIAIYLLAISIPYLVFAAWLDIPGSMPVPWIPQMLIPTAIDCIGGVAYYFFGTLLALRGAPWFGVRIAPVGAAIVATALSYQNESALVGVALVVLSGTLLGVLATEAFVQNGEFEAMGPVAKYLLTPIAGFGGYFVWLPVFLTIELFSPARESGSAAFNLVGDDGKIRRGRFQLGQFVEVETGNPVAMNRSGFAAVAAFSGHGSRELKGMNYRDPEAYCFLIGGLNERPGIQNIGPTLWYYDCLKDRVFAYDRASFRRIGVLGTAGYIEASSGIVPESRTGRFDVGKRAWHYGSRSSLVLLTSSKTAYSFSPDDRTLERVFEAPASERILEGVRWREVTAVRTDQALYLRRGNSGPFIRTQVADVARDYGLVKLMEEPNSDGILLFLDADYFALQAKPGLPSRMFRVDRSGALIPLQTVANPEAQPSRLRPADWALMIVAPQMLWTGGLAKIRMALYLGSNLILIGAAWSLCNRRRVPLPRTLWWIVWVGGMGGFALFALWMLESPKPRANCPSCSRSRWISEDRCPHCGSAWSNPKDGTEIFEPALLGGAV